jgi:DNA invertase Pin-like site-specific DNA recombinase
MPGAAKRLKWTVVDTYDDNDTSAYNGDVRKDFERLLADIKAGRINAIVCWHPDRLYRRVKDLQRLVEITDRGVQIASVNGGELDLSNSTGKMLARILGSVAEQESEHKGERRVAANADRAAKGAWRADGPRVFGYTQRGVPLEPEASAVRRAAQDVLNGVSLRSITQDWNARGLQTSRGKRWDGLTLRRMLMRPHYAALRTYQGKVVGPGEWEALFDESTHRGLVQLLTDPARRPSSAFIRKHMGSGVYVCGKCGAKLYGAHPHGPDKLVYVCRNNQHLGRAGAPIDAIVEGVVLGVLAETDIAKRLTTRPGTDTVALRVKRQTLVTQKDELATLFTDGVLDGPAVRRESEKLNARIAAIDAQLTEAARRSTAATMLADGPREVRRHWEAASPDIRGKIVDELMVVTVMPVPEDARGYRGFDHRLIVIKPKMVKS